MSFDAVSIECGVNHNRFHILTNLNSGQHIT